MSLEIRYVWASIRTLLVLTLILGVAYPFVIFGVGQVGFHSAANGSMIASHGKAVGSSLIGQQFTGAAWFQSRPSAAGAGYDPLASGASNLAPTSPVLLKQVEQRKAAIAAADGVAPAAIPADALTASGSGLDPNISPAYAAIQVARVARVRGLSQTAVQVLVQRYTTGRVLGFLGEPVVNVLRLNLALAATAK